MNMKIALASPRFPASVDDALVQLEEFTREAARQQAAIICFPESFIPGYPVAAYDPEKPTPGRMQEALESARAIASGNRIALILPMDWFVEDRLLNVAFVISATGEIMGYQSKNQLDPSEDMRWTPGRDRTLFELDGLTFGITICHEGFRYPESVRWAARRGASVVFHPQCTSSDFNGAVPAEWGHRDNPYYEKAMMMRALENTIYFASVNYAAAFQDSATSLVDPDGACVAYQPYGKAGVLVAEINPAQATGLLAKRYRPDLYSREQ